MEYVWKSSLGIGTMYISKSYTTTIFDRDVGGSSYSVHRDVWLLDCISRDDRTGMS